MILQQALQPDGFTAVRIAIVSAALLAASLLFVSCDSGPGRDSGWRDSPVADRELSACISEALRTSDGYLTRSEATVYCHEVFDCVWAEDGSLLYFEVSTMFDCVEDVIDDLGY